MEMTKERIFSMNGFQLMADSYKVLLKQEKIQKDMADSQIRIFEFLASCNQNDLCRLVNSSAFNDIIIAYVKAAVDDANIDDISKSKILAQIPRTLDQYSANEVLQMEKRL